MNKNLGAFFAVLILITACKKKFEILPEGAKQVSREDKTEEARDGGGDVSLREYKFTLAGQIFLCEAREFPDGITATQAAKKSIAERPQEEQKSTRAHFALSGRSVWLKADKRLTWCMLSTEKGISISEAMQPVRNVFLQRYKEAS